MNPDTAAAPSAAEAMAPARRRSAGDPVKLLMQRNRELCEQAVDPLEIAAGLEALGLTDRTAARFRHRDVFALAEEIWARAPHPGPAGAARPPAAGSPDRPARGVLSGCALALLPGALVLLIGAATGSGRAEPPVWAAALTGLVIAAGLLLPVPPGPRPAGPLRRVPWPALAVAALGYAWAAHRYGPAAGAGLAAALAPAHWLGAGYAARARRRLALSRTLDEFRGAARPLVPLALGLFGLAVLPGFRLLGVPLGAVLPLALLLFLARLCLGHAVPVTAALAVGLLPLPGAAPLAVAGLLVHATFALSRASAHTPTHHTKEKDMTGQAHEQGAAR
ncbi:hypothetical protein [Streptomyces sp. NPDC012888]|uniref:hypothetical protein n=1 Tax=Streptomyces sp. NPDC012888 TaxID=3364855 RepID=UPI0036987FFF